MRRDPSHDSASSSSNWSRMSIRQRVYLVLAIVLFIIAGLVMAYPFFSRWYAGTMQATVMQDYVSAVEVVTPQMRAEVFDEALRYNEAMAAGLLGDEFGLHIGDPFTFGSSVLPKGYFEQLSTPEADGMMATIEIPALRIKLPIYHGVDEHTLQIGIGHVPQSALPVGGAGTHSVLAGHRGRPGSLLFTDLDRLAVGDVFLIHVLDQTLAYEVHKIRIVTPDDVSSLEPVPGEDLMTLSTCTPLGVNSHRLLVHAHRVPFQPIPVAWPDANTSQFLIMLAVIGALFALFALVWHFDRRHFNIMAPK